MNKLVNRARAAMNFLIIVSLFLLFGLMNGEPNIYRTVEKIYELAQKVPDEARSNNLKKFLSYKTNRFWSNVRSEEVLLNMPLKNILILENNDGYKITPFEVQKIIAVQAQQDETEAILALADKLYRVFEEAEEWDNSLAFLKSHFEASKLSDYARVKDLVAKYSASMKLPLIGEAVEINKVLPFIAIFILTPLFYLLSTIKGIKEETKYMKDRKGTDWIFFHPGRLGVLLGSIWLFVPTAVVIVGMKLATLPEKQGLFLAIVFASTAGYGIIQIMGARKKFFDSLDEM